jgi:trimethylamine--corrinoid protein Co-methyltransferase
VVKVLRNFKIRVQPCLHFLADDQIEEIHRAALEVLERTGVIVHEDETLSLLSGAGCTVSEKNQVRIPPHVVEEALRSVPGRVTLSDRNGAQRLLVEGRKSYWGTGSDVPYLLDSFSGERRRTTLKDVEQVTRIVDALENIDFHMCMGVAHESSEAVRDKHHFVAMVSNTRKPIVFTASSRENLEDIYEMACMVAGSEESLSKNQFIVHYTEPISPLIHPRDSLEKLLFCAEKGIPVIYTGATTAAQNGPATLAGALVQCTARIVSGIVIAQLKRKGAKMIVTFHASAMDPRNAIHPYASPEHVICQAAAKDIANYYDIPTWGRAGCTDSKVIDQQAAFEAGYEILAQGLSGENLIHDVGYVESGLTASWDAIVMCDEFIGAVKRVVNGFELSEEAFALDVIDKVGPTGHYLTEPHTLEHFRKEIWIPNLIDRNNVQKWEEKGRMSLLDRANRRVREILDTHQPEPLDNTLLKGLRKLADKDNTRAG